MPIKAGDVARWGWSDSDSKLNWDNLAGGVAGIGDTVNALHAYKGDLYAGGSFSGQPVVGNIGRWDGEKWLSLGGGVTGGATPQVHSLESVEDPTATLYKNLIAGGLFTSINSGSVPVNNIAKWSTTFPPFTGIWADLLNTSNTGVVGGDGVQAIRYVDNPSFKSLFVGGDFSSTTGVGGLTFSYLQTWNNVWNKPDGCSTTSIDDDVKAIVDGPVFGTTGKGSVFIGGYFSNVCGPVAASRVALLSDSTWYPLPDAVGSDNGVGVGAMADVKALAYDSNKDRLYVGGKFSYAGGVHVGAQNAWDIAYWDTNTSVPGVGAWTGCRVSGSHCIALEFGPVRALKLQSTYLYVGGTFNKLATSYPPDFLAPVEKHRVSDIAVFYSNTNEFESLNGKAGCGVTGGTGGVGVYAITVMPRLIIKAS